jgi:hypothetical protein
VKHLNGSGLDPKSELIIEHVTQADTEEVFGKVAKFKTTNTHLHVDTKKELLHLCSQIYGTSIIMNNKFMSWVVKGYITESKGWDVNWIRANPLLKKLFIGFKLKK